MSSQNKISPADVRRLNKELAQTKRRLAEIENGRALRILKFTRQTLTNPLWAFKNAGKIPLLFKTTPRSEHEEDMSAIPPVAPGLEMGSFMQYPNLKVLTLGNVPDLSIYCHHLRFETNTWLAFHKVGMDVVLIGPGADISKNTRKQVAELQKNGTKVFALNTEHAGDSFSNLSVGLVVDLQKYNPIGLDDKQFEKVATTLNEEPLKLEKSEIHQYSIIECPPKPFENEFTHAQTVLNILSCGIPVTTEKTKTLGRLLPTDYPFVKTEHDKEMLYALDENWLDWKRFSVKIRRYIHLNHSPRIIAETIAKELTVPEVKNRGSGLVSIILSTNRPDSVEHALKNVKNQTYTKKELLLILHGDSFDLARVKKMTEKLTFKVNIMERPSNSIFGENLNLALDKAKGEYVTKMDDDDYYGPHHLEDLLAAFEYSRATIVGKWTNMTHLESRDLVVTFSGGREEKYVHHLPGATLFTKTEMLRKIRFGHVRRAIDTELYRRLESRGGSYFSTHSMNFIRVRHDKGHTYDTDIEDFIAHSTTEPIRGLDKEEYFA